MTDKLDVNELDKVKQDDLDSTYLPEFTFATDSEASTSPQSLLKDTQVKLTSNGMLKLYVCWSVAFLSTFQAGYATSTMTAINAIPTFQNYFDFTGLGVSTGLVFSMYPIAACVTFWIGPPIADRFGRRGGMFIASLVFLLGSVLLALSQNVGMLLAGRFFLGAGFGVMIPAASPYIVELAPPLNRGALTGMFNTCWLIGSIVATGISIGTSGIQSNWAWRIPAIIQMGCPIIMILTVFFLPESPRWLYANGQMEKAEKILMKYHGNGKLTPVVEMELSQMAESIRNTKTSRWDYKGLINTRAKRYRLMLALMMGSFAQLSGNGLSLFLPSLYEQVGVRSIRARLIMTLIASLASLFAALIGTYHTDHLGRRPVLIGGTLLCAITLAGAMGCSAGAGVKIGSDNPATNLPASRAAIAFLIMFGMAYAWGYTPLTPIYPSEVLSQEQRSTGMGLVVLVGNACVFVNQFAIPIALQKIGWWTYLPFICWDVLETIAWYLLGVETKGRTLEEMDEIFNSPNPVKVSLQPCPTGDRVEVTEVADLQDIGAVLAPTTSHVV